MLLLQEKGFEVGRGKKRPLTPSHNLIKCSDAASGRISSSGVPLSELDCTLYLVVFMFLRLGSGMVIETATEDEDKYVNMHMRDRVGSHLGTVAYCKVLADGRRCLPLR